MGYKKESNQPVCQHSMAACTVLTKAGLSQGTTYKVVLSEHTYVPTYDRPISVLTQAGICIRTSENICFHIGNVSDFRSNYLRLSRDSTNVVVVAIPQSYCENARNRIP
jgi:hypothetical protein